MRFEFEKFPGKGRGYEDRASIRKSGQLGFSTGSVVHYHLKEFDGAILYYDGNNRVVGVEPVKESTDKAACALIHRPGNTYVAAKSFFDLYQIPTGPKTERYHLWRDEDSGFLIIELTKPIPKEGQVPPRKGGDLE